MFCKLFEEMTLHCEGFFLVMDEKFSDELYDQAY